MASGTRGYRSYSGRGNKGKIALAILLSIIILAAAAFLLLQSRIYYDANGTPHIRLPEWSVQTRPLSPDDVELVFGDGDTEEDASESAASFTRYTNAFSVTEETLKNGPEAINTAWVSGITDHQAAAITLKDADGMVWFDSESAIPGSIKATTAVITAVHDIAESDVHTIARINTLHDPFTAKQWVTDMGLRNLSGYIFFDGNNSQWLDANKARTRQKICEMAAEAAEMGFNEILLTGFSYPTDGNMEDMNDGGVNHVETLESLLKEIRAALPEGVLLSVELSAETIQNGSNEAAGHRLSSLAPLVDTIYAETTGAEAAALRDGVAARSKTCGFVPEVTDAKSMSDPYLLLK